MSTELEQNVNKIKELLKSEDFNLVSNGLELARSLAIPALYVQLLEGCSVDDKGQLLNENSDFNNYIVCLQMDYSLLLED